MYSSRFGRTFLNKQNYSKDFSKIVQVSNAEAVETPKNLQKGKTNLGSHTASIRQGDQ
jgi:hypothetical protein